MAHPLLKELSGVSTPVIGMVHLAPLPGSPRYGRDVRQIEARMLSDAEALAGGGVSALCLENFGDVPFGGGRVSSTVVAHMTALAVRLRDRFGHVPLGINVLRNDGCSALAVAHAAGAHFVRVNVLCGARLTDQGIVEGIADRLMRLRAKLGAHDIRVFADLNVKHSAPLADSPLPDDVHDLIHRGLADALIVTGAATGKAADHGELTAVKGAAGDTPVVVGSGVSLETIATSAGVADGLIVGTALKRDGVSDNPVDPQRVKALIERLGEPKHHLGRISD